MFFVLGADLFAVRLKISTRKNGNITFEIYLTHFRTVSKPMSIRKRTEQKHLPQ
jgi:hypothetical protein